MAKKRLGEVLLEEGLIDEEDLEEALKYKEKSGYRLGTALVALRIIAEWQLTEALGKNLGLPVLDLANASPTPTALKRIPSRLAERFDLIPMRIEGRGKNRKLIVAMSDPLNRPVIQRMEDVAGCPVQPVLASLSAIQRAIRRHYHNAARSQVVLKAEQLRTAADSDDVFETLDDMRETTRQMTITHLREELKGLEERNPEDLPPPPTPETSPEPRFALEMKFKALLHLLLKTNVINGREYAEALKHLVESMAQEDK